MTTHYLGEHNNHTDNEEEAFGDGGDYGNGDGAGGGDGHPHCMRTIIREGDYTGHGYGNMQGGSYWDPGNGHSYIVDK